MAIIKQRNEFKDASGNLIDVVYVFEKEDKSIHKIGIGEENLLKTPNEQKQIAIDIFNSNNITVVITELNEPI